MCRKVPWLALLLLGVTLPATFLYARVFSSRSVDLFSPATYGRLIYKTVMEINGGKAEVNVVACDEGLGAVRGALTAHQDPALRLVALSPAPDKPALLVTVAQSAAEREASRERNAQHRLADVPVPPDGIVLGTMRSTDTRTTFERIASRMDRTEVVRFFESGLARHGWSRQCGRGTGNGFLVYVKAADLCMLLVTDQESNGNTGITLLHKQGAVE